MDAEAAVQRKADAQGARYYVIMFNSETIVPGRWYSQAILYRYTLLRPYGAVKQLLAQAL